VIVLITGTHGVELLDADAPHLSGLAQGIGRGDGIFETALYADGKINKIDEHLWRLKRSADLIDLEVPDDEAWKRAITTAVDAWQPPQDEAHIPGEALVKLSVIR